MITLLLGFAITQLIALDSDAFAVKRASRHLHALSGNAHYVRVEKDGAATAADVQLATVAFEKVGFKSDPHRAARIIVFVSRASSRRIAGQRSPFCVRVVRVSDALVLAAKCDGGVGVRDTATRAAEATMDRCRRRPKNGDAPDTEC